MSKIIIGYSSQKGYEINQTGGYDKNILSLVSKNAFPKGDGWEKSTFAGSKIFRCFLISSNKFAVSEVSILDGSDEFGRKGIMNAQVELFQSLHFQNVIKDTLSTFPSSALDQSKTWAQKLPWQTINTLNLLGIFWKTQILIGLSASNMKSHKHNACILLLASTLSSFAGNKPIEFSSYSLSHKREPFITAIPDQTLPLRVAFLPFAVSNSPLKIMLPL